MKKLHIVIALILALVLLVSLALPVTAASPTVLGYVSGATYGGYEKQPAIGVNGKVTYLADASNGSLSGQWKIHFFKGYGYPPFADTEWQCDNLWLKAPLPAPGNTDFLPFSPAEKTVQFMGVFKCVSKNKKFKGDPLPDMLLAFVITDSGEPGVFADDIEIQVWNVSWWSLADIDDIEHGNFQVYCAD